MDPTARDLGSGRVGLSNEVKLEYEYNNHHPD